MNAQRFNRTFRTALTVMAFMAMLGGAVITSGQNTQAKLPQGNWTLSAGPYSGPGHESSPIDVYSVTTDADRGLTVVSVALLNRSSKDVSAVKLRWYLKDSDQSRVLREGDTSLIDVDIPAGKSQILDYPVISFARVHKPLLKGAVLRGNYRIEVAVSEVSYADESTWVISKVNSPVYRKAAYHRPAQNPPCQNQGCLYNAENRSYQCYPNVGTFCSVTNTGRSCTETRCEGGGRPPILP